MPSSLDRQVFFLRDCGHSHIHSCACLVCFFLLRCVCAVPKWAKDVVLFLSLSPSLSLPFFPFVSYSWWKNKTHFFRYAIDIFTFLGPTHPGKHKKEWKKRKYCSIILKLKCPPFFKNNDDGSYSRVWNVDTGEWWVCCFSPLRLIFLNCIHN